MSLLFNLNYLLGLSGLILLALTIVLFVDYFYYQRRFYLRFISKYVWFILLLVTVGSVFLSLLYSEYFGFVPCSLCWLQRIALYPQALFALMAFKTKENLYYPMYSLGLAAIGLLVAVYHYVYQLLPKEVLESGVMPCLADGSSDCGTIIMNEFGFVTFPFMSAVTFAFLIILYLNLRKG